jgi:hypothetical protein
MLQRRNRREYVSPKYFRQEKRWKDTAARINCGNLLFYKGLHCEYPFCEEEFKRDMEKYGKTCHKTPDCMLSFSALRGDCRRCPNYTSGSTKTEAVNG